MLLLNQIRNKPTLFLSHVSVWIFFKKVPDRGGLSAGEKIRLGHLIKLLVPFLPVLASTL